MREIVFQNNDKVEEWRDVAEYEGLYQVGNMGGLKRIDKEERILKPSRCSNNYLFFNLCKNGIKKAALMHRLVATAFIPNPEIKPEVNHFDGVKWNNIHTNLKWATVSENRKHAFDTGLQSQNHSKKKVAKIDIITGETLYVYESLLSTHKDFPNFSLIGIVCSDKYIHNKTAYGYKWKYL